MRKEYIVSLTQEHREALNQMLRAGTAAARVLTRARILLKADQGSQGPGWRDRRITEALEVGHATVERTRQRFIQGGLEVAVYGRPSRRVYERKLDGRAEAHLVALACSEPPEGRVRWTMRLLAERMVELEEEDSLSHVTVWRTLKKTT